MHVQLCPAFRVGAGQSYDGVLVTLTLSHLSSPLMTLLIHALAKWIY